ncbi:Nicotinate phosphoribosyltransferase 2 [invertebrate metagenome]|uniref:nicotinate phosphoribosyltransferase n=1 Tax=invertebrate metagenome TaxID=1711999 RepID=A0A2H9T7P3_9ZZZZ
MSSPIIQSLLDTDLYKYTMQQSMVHRYPGVRGKMAFCNRASEPLDVTPQSLRKEVEKLASLSISDAELEWLASLPYIAGDFIDYLRKFRLNPSCVDIHSHHGNLEIEVSGKWAEITHFEIFLLAIISELHCRNHYGAEALEKGERCLSKKLECLRIMQKTPDLAGFRFVDFGTRRRYSAKWQAHIVRTFAREVPQLFVGTSNLHLARTLGLPPVGTMAHEWLQSHQVLGHSLLSSQKDALHVWLQEYRGQLGVALTDTISMDAFLRDFDSELAQAYDGLRHDSGDPVEWGEQALSHYRKLGIDARDKTLVFSDRLDLETAQNIYRHFQGQVNISFGIGTYLTNDMQEKAPNIVIKLVEVDGLPVAKLSDSPGKTICRDASFISRLKHTFHYHQSSVTAS